MTPQAMGASDPLRAYIITLRTMQRISQEALAEAAGIARRTYISWEVGETTDLKLATARRIIDSLGGSFAHLDMLGEDATPAQAQQLAERWLALDDTMRAELRSASSKLARIVQLGQTKPDRLEAVIDQLRLDASIDPAVLDLLSAFLAGRRSSRTDQLPRRGRRRRD